MKITDEHYNYLKAEITIFTTSNSTLHKQYKQRGLSDKRYRWDLVRYANLTYFICDTLYNYLNDDHIDTALKSIIKQTIKHKGAKTMVIRIRQKDKDKYIKNKGNNCPFCNYSHLTLLGEFKSDGLKVCRGILCEACGETWQNVYTLTTIL